MDDQWIVEHPILFLVFEYAKLLIVIGILLGLFIWFIVIPAGAEAANKADPQGYQDLLTSVLGGSPQYFVPSAEEQEWPVTTPSGELIVVRSVVYPFYIKYWNGADVLFYIPGDVWAAVMTAYAKYPNCDPRLNAIVAFSESPQYINYATENSAGAMGRWQFIPSTWAMMWPDPNNRPARTDDFAAADAACRYLEMAGVLGASKLGHDAIVYTFAVIPPVWNAHPPQGDFVARAWAQAASGDLGDVPDPDEMDGASVAINYSSLQGFLAPYLVDWLKAIDEFGIDVWPDNFAFEPGLPPITSPQPGDEWVALPYKPGTYSVSGGLHGQGYGQCAVDLVAGAFAPVFSPINGIVTQKYIDFLGNPVIRIENAQWVVLLLHGNWDNVSAGQTVSIWQQVGTESNRGNTWSNGKFCGTGSNCGFHTHFSLQKKGEICQDPFQRINFPATGPNP